MKSIKPFYVINWDVNRDKLVHYDIMPYLINEWENDKKRKHKLWVNSINSEIEYVDWQLGQAKGLKYADAIRANLSKQQKKDDTKMPETIEDFKIFVDYYAFGMYWARCEYEVIVTGWPVSKNDYKLDVYEQVKMNLDIVAQILRENLI